jgi:hypothetical protein
MFVWKEQSKPDDSSEKDFDAKLDQIIELFLAFVQYPGSIFAAGYDIHKLEEILFDFLISRDKRVSSATAILYGSDGEKSPSTFESEEAFVCARFLEDLEAKYSNLFSFLGNISNAAILSEVLLELGEGRANKDRKTELHVYVDAPIAMDAMGLSGDIPKDYSSTLIADLTKLGAYVFIFDHSVEEIRDNLYGLLKANPTERRGPSADALRSGLLDTAYVASVKNNVEDFVTKAGLQIANKPEVSLTVGQRSRFIAGDGEYLYQKMQAN